MRIDHKMGSSESSVSSKFYDETEDMHPADEFMMLLDGVYVSISGQPTNGEDYTDTTKVPKKFSVMMWMYDGCNVRDYKRIVELLKSCGVKCYANNPMVTKQVILSDEQLNRVQQETESYRDSLKNENASFIFDDSVGHVSETHVCGCVIQLFLENTEEFYLQLMERGFFEIYRHSIVTSMINRVEDAALYDR